MILWARVSPICGSFSSSTALAELIFTVAADKLLFGVETRSYRYAREHPIIKIDPPITTANIKIFTACIIQKLTALLRTKFVQSAKSVEIKKSYRELMCVYHPLFHKTCGKTKRIIHEQRYLLQPGGSGGILTMIISTKSNKKRGYSYEPLGTRRRASQRHHV
jgi:hypothetical protein